MFTEPFWDTGGESRSVDELLLTRGRSHDRLNRSGGSSSPDLLEPAATFDELGFFNTPGLWRSNSNLDGLQDFSSGTAVENQCVVKAANMHEAEELDNGIADADMEEHIKQQQLEEEEEKKGNGVHHIVDKKEMMVKFRLGSKKVVKAPVVKSGYLSEMFRAQGQSRDTNRMAGQRIDKGVEWTIYLPDGGDPITVRVNSNDTVEKSIERICEQAGLQQGGRTQYELRMHEGDGEPDTDFPPLQKDRLVRQYGRIDCEYCLVPVSGSSSPTNVGRMAMATSNSAASLANAVSTGSPSSVDHEVTVSSSSSSASPRAGSIPNSMTILIANTSPQLKCHLEDLNEKCVISDLLPMIAKKHRLRLYTDEYIFTVNKEDMKRLKWTYQTVADMNIPISFLIQNNVQELRLKKKGFADSVGGINARTRPVNASTKASVISASKMDGTSVVAKTSDMINKKSRGGVGFNVTGYRADPVGNDERGKNDGGAPDGALSLKPLGVASKKTAVQRQQEQMHLYLKQQQHQYIARMKDMMIQRDASTANTTDALPPAPPVPSSLSSPLSSSSSVPAQSTPPMPAPVTTHGTAENSSSVGRPRSNKIGAQSDSQDKIFRSRHSSSNWSSSSSSSSSNRSGTASGSAMDKVLSPKPQDPRLASVPESRSGRSSGSISTTVNGRSGGGGGGGKITKNIHQEQFQEWTVVKKNKFGRKQERLFAVDAFKVYHSIKRQGGINEGERKHSDISAIRSIVPVRKNDPSCCTFKILWNKDDDDDDSGAHDDEYTCATPKDCLDIVNKISFLLLR